MSSDKARQAIDNLAGIDHLDDFEWQYAHEYYDFDGSPERSIVSQEKFEAHKSDGHDAYGNPYWNYRQVRRLIGPWILVSTPPDLETK